MSEIDDLRRNVEALTRALAEVTGQARRGEPDPGSAQRRVIVSNAPIILFAFGRDGVFTLHEGQGPPGSSLKPGELVGKSIFDLYGSLHGAKAAIGRALEGEVVQWQSRNERNIYDVVFAPQRDFGGEVVSVTGIAIDVTARERAEAAVRASEDKYRRIVEKSSDGVVTADASMHITFVNGRFAELIGYEPNELLGRTTLELLTEESRALVLTRLPARKQGFAERMELRLVHRHGSHVPVDVRISPMMSDAGAFEGVLAQFTDLSDRRAAIARQNALAAVVETSEDAIISRGTDGIVRTWNPAAERLFQYSADEVTGKHISLLNPPELRARLAEVRADVDRGANVDSLIVPAMRKDGSRFEMSVRVSRLLDADGQVQGASVVVRDISAQRNAETALRRAEEQLRQAQRLESVGRLAGGVAHDFNNLLTVILSYADMALAGPGLADGLRDDLDQIRGAGQRAAALTRQLLAFSRKQILQPRTLDLNETVTSVEKMLGRALGEDVELKVVTSSPLGKVFADPGQIEQVLMNLAVNARDAMPDGGALVIETSDVVLDERYTSEHFEVAPGPYVRVVVTDDGTGIDPAALPRIFEPFFTTKEQGKGTGLGLSTVFGIVKQSGGHVSVSSSLGVGTTFEVYLPRTDRVAVVEPVAPAPRDVRGTETVLLVEDDPGVRSAMLSILRSRGYVVLEARNGGEALLACRQHRESIDLLITDVVMPGMNGAKVAERVKEMRPGLKVLFVSGYTDDTVVHHGVLDPGVHLLAKPLTPDAVARKVREVLDGDGRGRDPT
jgi:PAS domain S-box-containing protein